MDELELEQLIRQIDAVERWHQYDDVLLEPLANDEQIVPGCFWVRPAPTE